MMGIYLTNLLFIRQIQSYVITDIKEATSELHLSRTDRSVSYSGERFDVSPISKTLVGKRNLSLIDILIQTNTYIDEIFIHIINRFNIYLGDIDTQADGTLSAIAIEVSCPDSKFLQNFSREV